MARDSESELVEQVQGDASGTRNMSPSQEIGKQGEWEQSKE